MNGLVALNAINEIAYLAGVFNWNVGNGSYTNPDGSTVTFHAINNFGVPIGQYVEGAVNTFKLVNNAFGNPAGATDPNLELFNTQLTNVGLSETIQRKYVINRVPYANYDQPVDLGIGGQSMTFTVLFAGTMYQTALFNFIQNLFNNKVAGLGTLQHPFYNKVMKVLPLSIKTDYSPNKQNFVLCTVSFATSDISYLNPSTLQASLASEISQWYIGIQNAILSMAGTAGALKSGLNQFGSQL